MIYGAILAGGVGSRMENYTIPKQYIKVAGIPIIIRTVRVFLQNSRMNKIYIAVHKDWILYTENLFLEHFTVDENDKLKIVPGGKERIDSFINIMNSIIEQFGMNQEDILICHDSVRPFVKQKMIEECIEETIKHKLALTVVPVTDTIHISDDDNFINSTYPREQMYNGQTPSGFNMECLYNACNQFSDEQKHLVTGTTQLMLQLGYKIKMVMGHPSNLKITTDSDIEIADRILRGEQKKNEISLLDCTLRDGGIVVDFQFGNEHMKKIKSCLETSGVEYIECGYIDKKRGKEIGTTCFLNEKSIETGFLCWGKNKKTTYLAMIDHGKFDVNELNIATTGGIDGIRYAFHKEDWKEAIECGKIVIQKGYKLFIQPMVSTRYSDEEFRELIKICNKELPTASAFYIVDSFGQMNSAELVKKVEMADQYLSPNIKLGFHAHNNRQMAFSNALAIVNSRLKHEMIIDSCIMGMGKGAGNLCTELIIPVLVAEGKLYRTMEIYEEIASYFSKMMLETPWGYCLDYYLSSIYSCTPSYIKIFEADKRVSTDVLIDLLEHMPDKKKVACDKKFAEEYLKLYFEEKD